LLDTPIGSAHDFRSLGEGRVGRKWIRHAEYSRRRDAPSRSVAWSFLLGAMLVAPPARAQDLTPRAYVVTPLRSNAILVTDIYNDGDINFEGSVPIEDATGRINGMAVGLYHSLGILGRSANVTVILPYGNGTFEGIVLGSPYTTHRSGLFDIPIRFAVNLLGGPALAPADWVKWQQKTLLGASLKVVVPLGQYDPTRLINLGSNRWSFKPELGLSHRLGHWIIDAYGGAWFFTRNPEFFSRNQYYAGTRAQTQDPIGVTEVHLSYDVRPRLWVSLDGNFWYGGTTTLNGVENPITLQKSSRVGVTASVPLTTRQSIKLGFADGAYARFGGDYTIFSAAWQYSWVAKGR
jgi:hypothetical protein